MTKKTQTQQSPELSRRVATYSALATAAMLASPAADAALHIWDVNQNMPQSPWPPISVAASFSTSMRISFHGTSTTDRNFWGPNNNLSFINLSSSSSGPARLGPGVAVGPVLPPLETGSWSHAGSSGSNHDIENDWHDGDQGYMGIRFNAGIGYVYGWVDMTYTGSNPDTAVVTINRWALEDTPDTPALTAAGAVPEPGTGALLGLLALGATGLRRRRQSAAV